MGMAVRQGDDVSRAQLDRLVRAVDQQPSAALEHDVELGVFTGANADPPGCGRLHSAVAGGHHANGVQNIGKYIHDCLAKSNA